MANKCPDNDCHDKLIEKVNKKVDRPPIWAIIACIISLSGVFYAGPYRMYAQAKEDMKKEVAEAQNDIKRIDKKQVEVVTNIKTLVEVIKELKQNQVSFLEKMQRIVKEP